MKTYNLRLNLLVLLQSSVFFTFKFLKGLNSYFDVSGISVFTSGVVYIAIIYTQTLVRWASIKQPGVFARFSSTSAFFCCDHKASHRHSVLPLATDCIYSQAKSFEHMTKPANV